MEKINLSHTNDYYRLADAEAIRFLEAKSRLDQLRHELDTLKTKYQDVFDHSVKTNLPKILAVPAHLTAATVEGFVLAPLFNTIFTDTITNPSLLAVVSYLPICIFAGITLSAGHAFQKVYWKADEINPLKNHTNTGALNTALFISTFYMCCIGGLTYISNDMLGSNHLYSYVILLIGLAEIILGYWAIEGWECLYAYYASNSIEGQMQDEIKKIHQSAHKCEQQYTYFTQYWNIYCLNIGINEPPRINQRIQQTLDFCQVKDAPRISKRVNLIEADSFIE